MKTNKLSILQSLIAKCAYTLSLFLISSTIKAEVIRVSLENLTYDVNTENKVAKVVGAEENLKTIDIPRDIVYENVKYEVKGLDNECFLNHTNLRTVTIPSSVTSLGSSCFRDCKNLDMVTIPSSVTSIENACFGFCISLTEITLPEGLKELPNSCFSYCYSLSSITIPKNVTKIGNGCFYKCTEMLQVKVLAEDYCDLGIGCFSDCLRLRTFAIHAKTPPTIKTSEVGHVGTVDQFYKASRINLYVLAESIDDYKNSVLWSKWLYIKPLEEFQEEEISPGLIKLSNGKYLQGGLYYTLDIDKGEASFVDVNISTFAGDPSPAIDDSRMWVTNVYIPEQVKYQGKTYPVTSLGDNCLSGYRWLYSITIPSTVKKIGAYCFVETYQLNTIKLPYGLESIGELCFWEGGIKSIDLPPSVTSLGKRCFSGCFNLNSIIIRSDRISLGTGCFYDCNHISQMVCCAKQMPEIQEGVFPLFSFSNQGTLYVQKGLIDAFKVSEDWNCWKNILPIENYDPALGIAQAETNREKSGIIYDLQGRKVETPQAGGLYMKNGKKFIYRP